MILQLFVINLLLWLRRAWRQVWPVILSMLQEKERYPEEIEAFEPFLRDYK